MISDDMLGMVEPRSRELGDEPPRIFMSPFGDPSIPFAATIEPPYIKQEPAMSELATATANTVSSAIPRNYLAELWTSDDNEASSQEEKKAGVGEGDHNHTPYREATPSTIGPVGSLFRLPKRSRTYSDDVCNQGDKDIITEAEAEAALDSLLAKVLEEEQHNQHLERALAASSRQLVDDLEAKLTAKFEALVITHSQKKDINQLYQNEAIEVLQSDVDALTKKCETLQNELDTVKQNCATLTSQVFVTTSLVHQAWGIANGCRQEVNELRSNQRSFLCALTVLNKRYEALPFNDPGAVDASSVNQKNDDVETSIAT